MTNTFPRKPLAPMADRVARALAQEARVEMRLGNTEAAKACSNAFVAVVSQGRPTRRSAPTGRFMGAALTLFSVAAPVATLAGLLLSGLAVL